MIHRCGLVLLLLHIVEVVVAGHLGVLKVALFVTLHQLLKESLALFSHVRVLQGVRDAQGQELGQDRVLALVSVDLAVGSCSRLDVPVGVVKLALLLLKDSGDLHGCIGCLQRVVPVIALVDEIGLLEMLERLVLVFHS